MGTKPSKIVKKIVDATPYGQTYKMIADPKKTGLGRLVKNVEDALGRSQQTEADRAARNEIDKQKKLDEEKKKQEEDSRKEAERRLREAGIVISQDAGRSALPRRRDTILTGGLGLIGEPYTATRTLLG